LQKEPGGLVVSHDQASLGYLAFFGPAV
jgi:hypothetical protein